MLAAKASLEQDPGQWWNMLARVSNLTDKQAEVQSKWEALWKIKEVMQKEPGNRASTEEVYGPEAGVVDQSFSRQNTYLSCKINFRLQLQMGIS